MAYPYPSTPSGVDVTAWERAIDAVRDYCGWHVAPEVEETLTVDGPGGRLLALPTQRVADVSEILNDGTAVTDPEWSASGLVRGTRWSSKFRGVSVTLTHGYEAWPADILDVAANHATFVAAGLSNVSSAASGQHSVRFESPLSSGNKSKLDRYRLVGLP